MQLLSLVDILILFYNGYYIYRDFWIAYILYYVSFVTYFFSSQIPLNTSLKVSYGMSWHAELPILGVGGDWKVHLYYIEPAKPQIWWNIQYTVIM